MDLFACFRKPHLSLRENAEVQRASDEVARIVVGELLFTLRNEWEEQVAAHRAYGLDYHPVQIKNNYRWDYHEETKSIWVKRQFTIYETSKNPVTGWLNTYAVDKRYPFQEVSVVAMSSHKTQILRAIDHRVRQILRDWLKQANTHEGMKFELKGPAFWSESSRHKVILKVKAKHRDPDFLQLALR